MTEDEVQCERRKRLAGWVSEHGGASTVCHKRGLPKATESYISQILGGYSFGARAARNMEAKLGMPGGFLEPTYAFRKYQPPTEAVFFRLHCLIFDDSTQSAVFGQVEK